MKTGEPIAGKWIQQPRSRQSHGRGPDVSLLQLSGQLPMHFITRTCRHVTARRMMLRELVQVITQSSRDVQSVWRSRPS
jgi:hypothetical protein